MSTEFLDTLNLDNCLPLLCRVIFAIKLACLRFYQWRKFDKRFFSKLLPLKNQVAPSFKLLSYSLTSKLPPYSVTRQLHVVMLISLSATQETDTIAGFFDDDSFGIALFA